MLNVKELNKSVIEANNCELHIQEIEENIIKCSKFGWSSCSIFMSYLNQYELDCIESYFRYCGFISELTEDGELKLRW